MARDDIAKISGTTPDQRATWRVAAGGGARDFAVWARKRLDQAAAGQDGGAASDTALAEIRGELARLRQALNSGVGNNLKQLATGLNANLKAGKATSVNEASLAAIAADLAALRAQVAVALEAVAPPRRKRR